MNLTSSGFISVLKQIAMFYPYSQCNRLNCFAHLVSPDDLGSPSLNRSYQDYANGDFWARDWVAKGTPLDELKSEWPLLTCYVEKRFPSPGLSSGRYRERFLLNVIAPVECPSCSEDCQRTVHEIDRGLFDIAAHVIEALSSYTLMTITTAEGVYNTFGTEEYGAWLLSEELVLSVEYPGESLVNVIPALLSDDGVEVIKNGFEEIGLDGLRSVFFQLDVELCAGVTFDEDYSVDSGFWFSGLTAQCI